jgi:sirohydrochlorin cobaltochelatase
MTNNALILFAHGARDPRWAAPFNRLKEISQKRLPETSVMLAFLELMAPSLPDTVGELVEQGCKAITVVPVFLGQGGHVLRDLPLLLEELQQAHPDVEITVAQAVGENMNVLNAIADYCIASAGQNQALKS